MSDVDTILKANFAFANQVYHHLSKGDGNVLFSPIAMQLSLSMVFQGTSGKSEKDFTKILGAEKSVCANGFKSMLGELTNVENVFINAQKIYLAQSCTPKINFISRIKEKFSSTVETINFKEGPTAKHRINSWFTAETRQRIKCVVSGEDLNQETLLVLLNAVYFKGIWASGFDPRKSGPTPFTIDPAIILEVDMMSSKGTYRYGINKDLKSSVLQLHYTNKQYSMIVILPDLHNGISSLEKILNKYDLRAITDDLHYTTVEVYLPKFLVEKENDIEQIFSHLGAGHLFNRKAAFAEVIEGKENLKFSKAIQKAHIEISEDGPLSPDEIEFSLSYYNADLPSPVFLADHPFVYLILAETDSGVYILYLGRLTNPFLQM